MRKKNVEVEPVEEQELPNKPKNEDKDAEDYDDDEEFEGYDEDEHDSEIWFFILFLNFYKRRRFFYQYAKDFTEL